MDEIALSMPFLFQCKAFFFNSYSDEFNDMKHELLAILNTKIRVSETYNSEQSFLNF